MSEVYEILEPSTDAEIAATSPTSPIIHSVLE